jgi:adenylylsulfate kinase
LCRDLGYSATDRIENHRRIAEVARMFHGEPVLVLVATMAPEYVQRDAVKEILAPNLEWVFVSADLDVCIRRDPKGLYRKAREGRAPNLLEYPFAPPRSDEQGLVLDTVALDVDECHRRLNRFVIERCVALTSNS